MSILQRCTKCGYRHPLHVTICSCGEVFRGLRRYSFRKKISGKQHVKDIGRTTKEDAERKYAQWILEITQDTAPVRTEETMSVQALCDAHIARMKVNGKQYWVEAQVFYDRLVSFCSERGMTLAKELNSSTLIGFQTMLREAGYAPSHVDKHLRMISAAWNTSFRHRPNPVNGVKLYNPDNTLVRYLSAEEESALLNAAQEWDASGSWVASKAPPHLYVICLIALYTGMRESNILNLHTSEVDFEANIIQVTQKNGLPLTVVMNSVVGAELWRVRPEKPGYFFPHKDGKPYKRFDKTWKRLKEMAGIDRPFRIHDLRHTFGTNLGEITGNPRLVMEALGHRNIETTMKYFHVRPEKLRAGVEALAERASNGVPEGVPGSGRCPPQFPSKF